MTRMFSVEGAHLTATDRRRIKALLVPPGFSPGLTFLCGRKTYSITEEVADRLEVTIVEPDSDDFGRPIERIYRSTFSVRKPS